ncbi:MAG: choline transporter, partial [Desulfohalobiaceae bacterium]
LFYQPTHQEVLEYIQNRVKPALQEVGQELQNRGVQAKIGEGEEGRVWLQVLHGEEINFIYSVIPREYEPPAFTLKASRSQSNQEKKYYLAEVHLREGGQDYDIMNWSKQQVITDVLDQYERHLRFLDAVR